MKTLGVAVISACLVIAGLLSGAGADLLWLVSGPAQRYSLCMRATASAVAPQSGELWAGAVDLVKLRLTHELSQGRAPDKDAVANMRQEEMIDSIDDLCRALAKASFAHP